MMLKIIGLRAEWAKNRGIFRPSPKCRHRHKVDASWSPQKRPKNTRKESYPQLIHSLQARVTKLLTLWRWLKKEDSRIARKPEHAAGRRVQKFQGALSGKDEFGR